MVRVVRPAGVRRVAVVAAVAALLVGGVALAGGFAEVPRDRVPVHGMGGRYDNGLYAVSVRSVAVVDRDRRTGTVLERPEVVADVDLLYRGDAPTSSAPRWVRPLDVGISDRNVDWASVVDRRNGLPEPLQPGLPLRAVYTWRLPAGTTVEPGDPVRIGVYERYEVDDAAIEGVTTGSVLVAVFQQGAR